LALAASRQASRDAKLLARVTRVDNAPVNRYRRWRCAASYANWLTAAARIGNRCCYGGEEDEKGDNTQGKSFQIHGELQGYRFVIQG
jgi:hypothetical protein